MTLRECCLLFSDGDWIESKDQSDQGIRLIQTGNVGNGEYLEKDNRAKYISYDTFSRLGCTEIYPGDILISRLPDPVGRACIIPDKKERMITAVDCSILRVNQELVSRDYLLYFLMSPQYFNQLTNKLAGTTRVRISRKNLEQVFINLPHRDIQESIVNKINCLRVVISKRKEQLLKLDNLIKARFVEMFGDCRNNPKHWQVVALGDISQVGSSKRVFTNELKKRGIPFYRGTEIGMLAEGKSISSDLYISLNHYNELIKASGKPKVGDLLMPSICPDGRIWVVDSEIPFYFKDGRVLWIHDIDKKYDPVFLLYTLKDRITTDYHSIASGTTFSELKIFSLKNCLVFDVPLEKQKVFVSIVNQIDKSKVAVQKALDKAQLLFDSLMQEYFG